MNHLARAVKELVLAAIEQKAPPEGHEFYGNQWGGGGGGGGQKLSRTQLTREHYLSPEQADKVLAAYEKIERGDISRNDIEDMKRGEEDDRNRDLRKVNDPDLPSEDRDHYQASASNRSYKIDAYQILLDTANFKK